MKSNFKRTSGGPAERGGKAAYLLLAFFGSAGLGLAILAGCTNGTPFNSAYPGLNPTPNVTPVYLAPTAVPNRNLVCNFDNGTTLINPYLMEMNNPPNYVLKFDGSVTAVNNFGAAITFIPAVPHAVLGGPNGSSPYAFQVYGTVTDLGNAQYPAVELEVPMEGGTNLYDGSFFSGVKFYLKIAGDDNTTKRDFSIPVYQTQGLPQGGCVGGNSGGCFDNFTTDLTAGTGGQWKSFSIPFSSLQQAYAGVVTTPNPNFAGQNLQQMLWLQWEESRNNTAGTSTFDYWLAAVSFY